MPPKIYSRLWIAAIVVLVSVATGAALMRSRDPGIPDSGQSNRRSTTATVTRQDFLRTVRLSGTVEAVESTTVAAPRLMGPNSNSLVITKLVKPGTRVEKGDLIVEFDRQTQIATALDRLQAFSQDRHERQPDQGHRGPGRQRVLDIALQVALHRAALTAHPEQHPGEDDDRDDRGDSFDRLLDDQRQAPDRGDDQHADDDRQGDGRTNPDPHATQSEQAPITAAS